MSAAAIGALCLAAGALHVRLPVAALSLRWQHSIEKVLWEEDYQAVGPWLLLSQARIRGSGAGMEPPEGARLFGGAWHYRLADPWRREVVLARSGFARDYELCFGGACRPLSRWVPIAAGPTTLSACESAGHASPKRSGAGSHPVRMSPRSPSPPAPATP